jgi:hypothetical protein
MQQPSHRNAAVENNFSSHDLDKGADDEVSDISEEDFLPGEHEQGHNVASMKKFRVFWNQQKEEYLLRCFNYYRLTHSSDHGLKGKSWKRIGVRMSQEFGEEYDPKACRNKVNVLRSDYAIYKEIVDARNTGKETEEFWNELITRCPRAAKWKDNSSFPHYEMLRRILEEHGGEFVLFFFFFFSFTELFFFYFFFVLFSFRSGSRTTALSRDPGSPS